MVVAIAKYVLRGNREKSAECERPERASLWLDEKRKADAAYVRTLEVDDLASIERGEQRLGRHARCKRHREPFVSAEHVLAHLRCEEDERDEKCDQIARINSLPELP